MLRFPGEEEREKEIGENLRDQLAYWDSLYKHWLENEHDRWAAKAGLPGRVYLLVSALNIQSLRLYRSVVEECKRGEAMSATILCRSLFETIVALLFALKPKVAIRLAIKKDKLGNDVLVNGRPQAAAKLVPLTKAKKGDLLTPELRATLYFAHAFIEHEDAADTFATKRGLKKFHRGARKHVDAAEMAEIEREIGKPWSYVLRNHPRNYCGLSISKLCRYLDPQLGKYYDTIYSIQCGDVHAANARRHLRHTGEGMAGQAVSDVGETLIPLKGATLLFKGILDIMDEYVGYGVGNRIAMRHFEREYNRIFKQPKARK